MTNLLYVDGFRPTSQGCLYTGLRRTIAMVQGSAHPGTTAGNYVLYIPS